MTQVLFTESEKGLQCCAQILEHYCTDWGLKVNQTKNKAMVFTANGRRVTTNIVLKGEAIETVNTYKYLGVIFSSSGSFTKAIDDLYRRALKANFQLISLLDSKKVNFKTSIHLFDHLVKPVILYATKVWAPLFLKRKENLD